MIFNRSLEKRLARNDIEEELLNLKSIPKSNHDLLFCEGIYHCRDRQMDCLYGKKDCYFNDNPE